jgi:arylsulfatase
MQALFLAEAERNQVLPLDDRSLERFSAALAGRPDPMAGRSSLTLSDGMVGMQENVFLNVKNKSLTITADVEIPAGGGNGTLIAQGGRFGGWSLYMQGGKPAYGYNFLGLEQETIASTQAVPAGKAQIQFDFAYDGGGMGKGGTGTLRVNGKQVAQGRIEHTQPLIFSADETADVGVDLATAVVPSVGAEKKSRFDGKIPKLVVEIRDASPAADAAAKQGREDALGKRE